MATTRECHAAGDCDAMNVQEIVVSCDAACKKPSVPSCLYCRFRNGAQVLATYDVESGTIKCDMPIGSAWEVEYRMEI